MAYSRVNCFIRFMAGDLEAQKYIHPLRLARVCLSGYSGFLASYLGLLYSSSRRSLPESRDSDECGPLFGEAWSGLVVFHEYLRNGRNSEGKERLSSPKDVVVH
jgi:hypothetical protein